MTTYEDDSFRTAGLLCNYNGVCLFSFSFLFNELIDSLLTKTLAAPYPVGIFFNLLSFRTVLNPTFSVDAKGVYG